MNRKIFSIINVFSLAAILAMSPIVAPAAEYFLRAESITKTMPDGAVVTMWGFAKDSAFGAKDGEISIPGPILTVPSGDTTLTIHLDNNLTVPISIVINGQTAAAAAPVRFGANDPDYAGRIRSFTHETEPNNAAPVNYVWNNFKAGTCLYTSGTHAALQVQMGLFGAVKKDFAAGEIYSGAEYDSQMVLLYSEVDPVIHSAVATNNYGRHKLVSSTIDYQAKYAFINGKAFTAGQAAIPTGAVNGDVLLRVLNAGLRTHCPLMPNFYMEVLAEDGFAYANPKTRYVLGLTAGKTLDTIITPTATGSYPIMDRRLSLTNNMNSPGGMLAYLQVVAQGNNIPPVAVDGAAVTPVNTAVAINVTSNDTDADGTIDPTTVVIATQPADGNAVLNPATGVVTYTPAAGFIGTATFTYTVEDNDGAISNIATVSVIMQAQPNIPPVAADDSSITNAGRAVAINVLANDTDPNGAIDPTSVMVTDAPANGTTGVNATTGAITYTPGYGFGGEDDIFYYVVADSNGMFSNAAKVTVTVNDFINITRARYYRLSKTWEIIGTAGVFVPDNSITIHLGNTLAGPVLATVDVSANGTWRYYQTNSPVAPDATRRISLESSRGASRLSFRVSLLRR